MGALPDSVSRTAVYDISARTVYLPNGQKMEAHSGLQDKMFGRDGMLAHSYMLGPNGQSNGCVSFKDYDKFLQAFLDGKVDKLVVVADLGNTRWQTAALQADGVSVPARRFASTTSRASRAKRYASFFGEEPGYSPALGFAPTERGAGTW